MPRQHLRAPRCHLHRQAHHDMAEGGRVSRPAGNIQVERALSWLQYPPPRQPLPLRTHRAHPAAPPLPHPPALTAHHPSSLAISRLPDGCHSHRRGFITTGPAKRPSRTTTRGNAKSAAPADMDGADLGSRTYGRRGHPTGRAGRRKEEGEKGSAAAAPGQVGGRSGFRHRVGASMTQRVGSAPGILSAGLVRSGASQRPGRWHDRWLMGNRVGGSGAKWTTSRGGGWPGS